MLHIAAARPHAASEQVALRRSDAGWDEGLSPHAAFHFSGEKLHALPDSGLHVLIRHSSDSSECRHILMDHTRAAGGK
jgi:hypothetical protein